MDTFQGILLDDMLAKTMGLVKDRLIESAIDCSEGRPVLIVISVRVKFVAVFLGYL